MEVPAKLKLPILRIQLVRKAVLHFSLLNRAGLVVLAVQTVYPLLLIIPSPDQSVYCGLILKEL